MISVIIPVYNVEKYIDKCITSILNQTYEDFELLLVDDGSTDKSREICERYAADDHRVCVFHEENRGVSAARNEGLRRFKGNYLTFIDSDDYVEPNYFQTAMTLFEEHKEANVLIFGMNMINNGKMTSNFLKEKGLMTVNQYLENAISPSDVDFGGGYPVNKIWKITEREKVILFDEALYSKEDRLWVFQMLLGCNKVWLDNNSFYNYVYNNTSLTHTKKNSSGRRLNGIEAFKKISLLDFHDSELQKLSYISFCRMLVHRFCDGLLCRDVASVTDIYTTYKEEWNRIFKCMVRHGKLKAKAESVVCFIAGHTLCKINDMIKGSK